MRDLDVNTDWGAIMNKKKRKIVGICSSVGNKAKATNNTYPIIFINRVPEPGGSDV